MSYALVTGASSGIGLEYSRQLASKGYDIIVVSNRREDNVKVAETLSRDFKVKAMSLYADLSQNESAQDIYDWCRKKELDVEILISNAGILHFGKLEKTDLAAVDRIMNIHCNTPVKLCRLFAEDMLAKGKGHILIMSSITAWTPYPTMSLYGSTKVFLKNFGQSLWYELHGRGVSVTTVFPSAVDTPFYELDSKMRKRLLRIGMMVTPEKLVRKALKSMFKCRRIYIPGFMARVEIFLCQIAPAKLLLPIMRIPALKRLLDNN